METLEEHTVEQVEIEDHSDSVDVDDSSTVKADGLQSSLHELADSFDVTGFKCAKCGLAHMHDTTKHRLSDSFDSFDTDDVTDMEYNSVCHCGVQEAGRRGGDLGVDEGRAARIAGDAPIPPESSRTMDDELGTL
jgi:hypothetical protein